MIDRAATLLCSTPDRPARASRENTRGAAFDPRYSGAIHPTTHPWHD